MLVISLLLSLVAAHLVEAAAPTGNFAGNNGITFTPAAAWFQLADGRSLPHGTNPEIVITTTASSSATFTVPGGPITFSLVGWTATNQGRHLISIDGEDANFDAFSPQIDRDDIDVQVLFSTELCGPPNVEHSITITHGGNDTRTPDVNFLVLFAYTSTPHPNSAFCARAAQSATSISTTPVSSAQILPPPTTRPFPSSQSVARPTPNIVNVGSSPFSAASEGVTDQPAGSNAISLQVKPVLLLFALVVATML